MRMYAVSNRSLVSALLVGVLSMAPFGVNTVLKLQSALLKRGSTSDHSQFLANRTESFRSTTVYPSLPPSCLAGFEVDDRQMLMFVISARFELVMDAHQRPQLCGRSRISPVQYSHGGVLHIVSLVARVPMIVSDTIVIVATWMSLRHQVNQGFNLTMRSRVSVVMLADGKFIRCFRCSKR